MRSLFVMDPLDRLHVAGDSTYAILRECTVRGHPSAWCTPGDLVVRDGEPRARVRPVRALDHAPWFDQEAPVERALGEHDVVWMRKDPPFDMSYVLATYVLDMVPAPTRVINGPAGLKLFNEKLWAMHFPELQPPTLLSSDPDRLRRFVRGLPGRAVIKPWDGNGGLGVLVTDGTDRNLRSMLDLLTDLGRRSVIAQAFIERADEGDKRVLLFEGEPVGAVLRVPSGADWRGNLHVGAEARRCTLDERDTRICETLAPHLRRWDQVFVGIDIIDGYLTEINVTSPTGIREIDALDGVRLEADLVDRVERRLSRRLEDA